MEYYLYPPYFISNPQSDFSDAWEDFCRFLLNLEHQTTDIRRRTPPDLGADLLWDTHGIAYQCKAVESGQPGRLKMSDVLDSIEDAKKNQARLGWKKYILCTNVDITGTQDEKLKAAVPDIKIRDRGYWTDLCKKFHHQIKPRFRRLIPFPEENVKHAINQVYYRTYLQSFQNKTSDLTLHVCSATREEILELPVYSKFTVHEIHLILRELFELPDPKIYRDLNITLSLDYSLHINNKEAPPHKKLAELVTGNYPLVALWKIIIWHDNGREIESITMEDALPYEKLRNAPLKSPHGPAKIAVQRYRQEIEEALDKAILRFGGSID